MSGQTIEQRASIGELDVGHDTPPVLGLFEELVSHPEHSSLNCLFSDVPFFTGKLCVNSASRARKVAANQSIILIGSLVHYMRADTISNL